MTRVRTFVVIAVVLAVPAQAAADDAAPAVAPPDRDATSFLSVGTGLMFGWLRYWNEGGAGLTLRGGVRRVSGRSRFGAELALGGTRLRGGEGRGWRDSDAPGHNVYWLRFGPRYEIEGGRQSVSAALHAGVVRFAELNGFHADVTLGWAWKLGASARVGLTATLIRAATGFDRGSGWFVELGPEAHWAF